MRWANPDQDTAKRTVCPFCGMGCTLLVRPGTGAPLHEAPSVHTLDYDATSPVNRGSLCGKGNMTLELMDHGKRLDMPALRDDGSVRPVSWDGALATLVQSLSCLVREEGPSSVGILVGPSLTNEEARLAVRLAKALRTGNLDLCQPEDRAVSLGVALSGATVSPVRSVAEIEAMTAILVVGDLFTTAPCMAKPILEARYKRRQNLVGVIDSSLSRTGWFGKPVLRCRPGMEVAALAQCLRAALALDPAPEGAWVKAARACCEKISAAEAAEVSGLDAATAAWFVGALAREKESGVFYAAGVGGRQREVLAAGLAALLAQATNSRFAALSVGANAVGVERVLSEQGFPGRPGLTAAEMIEAAVTGDLKALVAVGCDPVASFPGGMAARAAENLEFFAAVSPLPSETTARAHLVLPCAVWGETAGTVVSSFLAEAGLSPVLPPPGAARPGCNILGPVAEGVEKALAEFDAPPVEKGGPDRPAFGFFEELEFFFRLAHRGRGAAEAGTHLLTLRSLAPHSGNGAVTRHFSWARHEFPDAPLFLSPSHAAEIGVREGEKATVRSRSGEAVLTVWFDRRVPEGTVVAAPHYPEVRGLIKWNVDPTLREVDIGPGRVSVEKAGAQSHG